MVDFDNDFAVDDEVRGEQPSLDATLQALREVDSPSYNTTIYYGLSGLSDEDITQVKPVWEALDAELRRRFMAEFAELSEVNFHMDYRAIAFLALNDRDPGVRVAAINALWIDESMALMSRLMEMAQSDDSERVRAAAVIALGRFILLGEYEEIPENEALRAQDVAVELWTNAGETLEVRRRALEAIANSQHEIVEGAIDEAYRSDEHKMRVSAIFAMGRTCDSRWKDTVLREMDSEDPEIRYEATRAAGQIGLRAAIPQLARLSQSSDRDIKEVAIWSLGEIGGAQAMDVLGSLADDAYESDDPELLDAIEEATGMAVLGLSGELDLFMLDEDDQES